MRSTVIVSVFAMLVVACENGSSPSDAGGIDPPSDAGPFMCPCAIAPTSIPPCGGSVCGNGVRDQCWSRSPMGCKCVMTLQEPCDGLTCAEAGFYGTGNACSSTCSGIDTSTCEACGPDATECVDRPADMVSLATNGTQLAISSRGAVALYDGSLAVTATTPFDLYARPRLAAVPSGWLVALESPPSITTMNSSGVVGTATSLPVSAGLIDIALSPVANGHALVAWTAVVNNETKNYMAIVSEAGSIVVQPTQLFASGAPLFATDGTDIFVVTNGELARVTTAGIKSSILTSSFGPAVSLTWHGTYGILASSNATTTQLQRFDANGAIGTPVTVQTALATAIADGPDLIGLEAGLLLNVVAIDATTGALGASKEIGAYGIDGKGRALAWDGSDIVVAWGRPTRGQLARTSPP